MIVHRRYRRPCRHQVEIAELRRALARLVVEAVAAGVIQPRAPID